MRERLRDLIAERALSTGEFTLASGAGTQYFFDMKQVMLDPEGPGAHRRGVSGADRRGAGGPYRRHRHGRGYPSWRRSARFSRATPRPRRAFFVRKETKDHGTERRVEGYLPEGGEVLLFEDVTTTGGSAMIAVEAARAPRGCRVETLYTVVDRLEGAEANLAREGIRLAPLFTRDDFTL